MSARGGLKGRKLAPYVWENPLGYLQSVLGDGLVGVDRVGDVYVACFRDGTRWPLGTGVDLQYPDTFRRLFARFHPGVPADRLRALPLSAGKEFGAALRRLYHQTHPRRPAL